METLSACLQVHMFTAFPEIEPEILLRLSGNLELS